MPDPTPRPMVLSLDLSEPDTVAALDLIRRVRSFAEEMRAAGLDVEVRGDLSIVVRTPAPLRLDDLDDA